MIGKKQSQETIKKRAKKISLALKGRKATQKTKENLSLSHRGKFGEKSSNWQGGISKLKDLIRGLFQYRQWRSDIFTRDNFICQKCFKKGYIEAHHIISLSVLIKKYNIKTIEDAINCQELWNINNGVTLCLDCHKKTDNYKGKANKKV